MPILQSFTFGFTLLLILVNSTLAADHDLPVTFDLGRPLTPLERLHGTITPADLQFERHHGGVPQIDPVRLLKSAVAPRMKQVMFSPPADN